MSHVAPLIHAARTCLIAGLAAGMAACTSPSQKMDLSPDMIATPPHRMARTEYPFDSSGRYVDAWAAAGAGRYGRTTNTDHTEDGRGETTTPQRRPTPPSRATTTKPAAKPSAKPTAKPPAKKPPAKKKSTTHTVKRGDSLGSLSRRYGVSVQSIKKANGLKSDRIIDGRKLVIPK